MQNILSLTTGLFIGVFISYLTIILSRRYYRKKTSIEIKKQFSQIIENLKKGNSEFKTRIKDTVLFETNLFDFGKVGIVYVMDKKEISICKEDKIIYNSSQLDQSTLTELMYTIENVHGQQINDTVEINGVKIFREEFEKTVNIQMEEMKKNKKNINKSDISNIIKTNDSKLDIDEILDKINSQGIQSLTKRELEFLKKFR